MGEDAAAGSRGPSFRFGRGLGASICLAGVLVCIGAWAPWFSISLLSVSAHIGGFSAHLDGRYALVLGLVALVLGAAVILTPAQAVRWRQVGAALVLVGLGGVLMVWHEYVHLTNTVTTTGRTSGLTPFAKYFDVHGGAAWGLWLTGGSLAGLAVIGLVTVLAGVRYSSRSAPPSTGMAHPVRYDAAGERTNAATRPNSSGSP